jgi:general secretion pathway protein G
MPAKHWRAAFTLIEVLIVVVIISVMAAIVIPHFVDASNDARASALAHNLSVLRAQIQLYKINHGSLPTVQNGSLPQLTSATNAAGVIGTPGPDYPYLAYIAGGRFPENPYDQKNTVTETPDFPPTASTSDGGWLYHTATGEIAANTDGHLND